MRIYEVGFMAYVGDDDGWTRNWSSRTVAVEGDASEAITKAAELEGTEFTDDAGNAISVRAEYVKFIAEAE